MAQPPFVDCHSHVLPADDDGAETIEEGLRLCEEAAAHGTAVLFATPHVWPTLALTDERERRIRANWAELAARAPLELRLGYELTPTAALTREDPHRYRLSGTDCVLMEVPFTGPAEPLFALAEHVERAGLRPIIAHPERADAVLEDESIAFRLADRGWTLQVNATSLSGYHGERQASLGWRLVEEGRASLVASDGHRLARPPRVDDAWRAVERRLGVDAARFFDGSALGFGRAADERRATASARV